ncbi:winged helix-turn-helix domain-containing protein [Bacteroidales bacterium OttesenSCG-928-M11]|nr:winged helix-turn-helix domain-containing protein [Bacteroidales bacterium OttesenSCG-928-M11]
MKEKIGNDAGRIWNLLNESDAKSVKELKKALKMNDKEIYAAIGWLSREEKLECEKKEDDLYISLI